MQASWLPVLHPLKRKDCIWFQKPNVELMPYAAPVTLSPKPSCISKASAGSAFLMSLSVSLANAGVMALSFQKSWAVFFYGSINFPVLNCCTRAWSMWRNAGEGKTCSGIWQGYRKHWKKITSLCSLIEFCLFLTVILKSRLLLCSGCLFRRAEGCEVQFSTKFCLFHMQLSKGFCSSLVTVPVQTSTHRT